MSLAPYDVVPCGTARPSSEVECRRAGDRRRDAACAWSDPLITTSASLPAGVTFPTMPTRGSRRSDQVVEAAADRAAGARPGPRRGRCDGRPPARPGGASSSPLEERSWVAQRRVVDRHRRASVVERDGPRARPPGVAHDLAPSGRTRRRRRPRGDPSGASGARGSPPIARRASPASGATASAGRRGSSAVAWRGVRSVAAHGHSAAVAGDVASRSCRPRTSEHRSGSAPGGQARRRWSAASGRRQVGEQRRRCGRGRAR